MNGKRAYLFAALAVLAVLSVWMERTADQVPAQSRHAGDVGADYLIKDFTATRMDVSGKPQQVLVASRLTHYPADPDGKKNHAKKAADKTLIETPRLTVYREIGAPWVIEAERADASGNTEVINMRGKVVILREQSPANEALRIDTVDLAVRDKDQYAETGAPTLFTTARGTARGTGMQAWMREGRLRLLDKVNARFQ